jgi:hypothetical protein
VIFYSTNREAKPEETEWENSMIPKDKEIFAYYNCKIATIAGHEPVVKLLKSGGGFSCKCTCGKPISCPSGCNRAGFVYAVAATAEKFNRHVAKRNEAMR